MIIVPYRFTREYLKSHPELTFIYGCNLYMPVYMGQSAFAQGLENCYSVPTKFRNCKSDNGAYFSDINFNVLIKPAIDIAISIIPRSRPIILFPKIGQGCAQMPRRAPKCFKYLMEELDKIKAEYTIDYKML